MKNLTLFALFIFYNITTFAQSTVFKERIYINPGTKVFYTVDDYKGDSVFLKKGSTLTSKKKYTIEEIEYFNTEVNSVQKDTLVYIKTGVPKPFFHPSFVKGMTRAKASITPDEEDPSILHVNYWLDPENIVPANRDIKIITGKWYGEELKHDTVDTVFKEKYSDNLTYIETGFEHTDFFKNALYKLAVYKVNTDTVEYYLIKAFDRTPDYYVTIDNRSPITFGYKAFEIGALTIPFKYRPAYNSTMSHEFSADFNIGTYVGVTVGRIKYTNRKKEPVSPGKVLATFGGFFTISRIEVEDTPLGAISPGVAAMLSVYGFKIGLFVGNDIAIGDKSGLFRQNYYPWYGFGIGYNIGLLWDK